jgi:hypothetical protein
MFDEKTDFVEVINRYVSTWTKKYIFYTKLVSRTENEQKYMTEFSLPTKEKTIPICTIRVGTSNADILLRKESSAIGKVQPILPV